VLYVEELIGPDTVNTVPPATLDAFRDHGKLRDSLAEMSRRPAACWRAGEAGISLDAITEDLVKDGVKAVRRRRDKLYVRSPQARDSLGGASTTRRSRSAPASRRRSRRAPRSGAHRQIRRLWRRTSRLDRRRREQMAGLAHQRGDRRCRDYEDFARRVKGNVLPTPVVLHGRFELGPEVLADTFPHKSASEAACASTPPIRRRCARGSVCRHREDTVHRIQQVRRQPSRT